MRQPLSKEYIAYIVLYCCGVKCSFKSLPSSVSPTSFLSNTRFTITLSEWISRKDKMATFERYFLAEKETHKEKKNPYYSLLEEEEVVNGILSEFGLPSEGTHIVNGHVPVKSKNGENPVKCGGKGMVIDGGFIYTASQKDKSQFVADEHQIVAGNKTILEAVV